MAIKSKLKNLVKRFAKAQQGSVGIVFGLSAFGVILAAGAAIDYSRFVSARTHLQAALDAGALAAASAGHGKSDAQRQAIGLAAFNANVADGLGAQTGATPNFNIVGDKIDATAQGWLPSGFIQLAGIDQMNVEVGSQVNIPVDKKAEIVLVLDYSGSMKEISGGSVKYKAMRKAAKKLVSDLEAANPNSVKFGLVPFSHHVWVTLPKQYVVGQTGAGDWTGCTQDRMNPYNLTDETPLGIDETKWGHPQADPPDGDKPHGGCAAYVPNKLVVKPLTNDFWSVKDQLDRMLPYAYTHIALGVEFGFHLLSPNAPFEQGVSYGDANTEKIMVVLTDGRQTERAFGPGGSREVVNGETNLAALCEAAKAKGITMMTIAYDLRDEPTTTNRLRNCSTDPDRHFFIAESGGDIASAFESIRNEITAQVVLSR